MPLRCTGANRIEITFNVSGVISGPLPKAHFFMICVAIVQSNQGEISRKIAYIVQLLMSPDNAGASWGQLPNEFHSTQLIFGVGIEYYRAD